MRLIGMLPKQYQRTETEGVGKYIAEYMRKHQAEG
jgi:hypothetical protein